MTTFWQDLRYATRVLLKNPGATVVMAFTLTLAIGATTAIFSVVYGVLFRPLPYSRPERIMAVSEINSKGRPSRLADPNFDDFHDQSSSFQYLAKYSDQVVSVSGASQPTRTTVAPVTPGDNKKGAAPTALVSYGYWAQYLASTQDLSQAHLKIDDVIYSVIGVLP